ncbi:MAG: cell division protein FtsX, partial [Bacteroidetes bacterium]
MRHFFKDRLYFLINILSLATGIACFAILFLLILHETSYDSSHHFADRTYRIIEKIEKYGVGERSASVPLPLCESLLNDYPELFEKGTRLFNYQLPSINVALGEFKQNEKNFFFADPNFLDIFDFPLQIGDRKTALK